MNKLFHHPDYDPALYPREGLTLEFKSRNEIFVYLYNLFSEHFSGPLEEFMTSLTNAGIIRTIVTVKSYRENESIRYVLDCHALLIRLGLVDAPIADDGLQFYTIQETASLLSVTRQTVYNLINAGLLQPVKLNGVKGQRISKGELLRYTHRNN